MEQMFDIAAYRDQRDTTIPRFYIKTMVDERASKKEGHQVFVDVEMVEIITPGDKLNVPHCVVKEMHKRRYEKQYEAFKKGVAPSPEGFRLEAWPHLSAAEAATLKACNCHTVEQLADMAEANRPKLPRFFELQKLAREFVESQKDASVVVALQTQVEDLRKELQHAMNTVDALKKTQAEEAEEPPKRRGRPPKVA